MQSGGLRQAPNTPNASCADEVVEEEGRLFWEAWLMQGLILRDGSKWIKTDHKPAC